MRALVVTNMYPRAERPELGSFVRDQVTALARVPGVDVELFAFAGGGMRAYLRAAAELRSLARGQRFDVVHAHFGLTAWPALAIRGVPHVVTLHGTDLAHPRSRAITLAALRFVDLVATVSEPLARELPRRTVRGEVAVLPCGVDTGRFRPIPRRDARRALGLDEDGRYLLFPASPARAEKRHDRACALAAGLTGVKLLALGHVDPRHVPLWVNAANAVLVPSEREGFGLAVLEALACDVPVLATPVGVAAEVLSGIDGTYCGPFDVTVWRDALSPLLADADRRVAGRSRAERFSSDRMAARVLAAWRALVERRGRLGGPAG